jgi:hypothetical protein
MSKNLPSELSSHIESGKQELARNANGELILPFRKRIWRAMGPPPTEEQRKNRTSDGLKRRAKLAALCANHVLSVWIAAFRTSKQLDDALRAAGDYLAGRRDWDSVWKMKNDLWTKLDNLMNEGKTYDAVYAGYATAGAMNTALNDERMGDPTKSDQELDEQLDPFEWDASFYSSLAYSRGAPWEKQSDSARRREFWQWFLNDGPCCMGTIIANYNCLDPSYG